MCD
jgi:SpoVK/Ycf46/Vps4 family AAA+-type ATPase